MSISDLAAELANDPESRGYSGMTDAEAAADLNAVNRPGPTPAKDVQRYLLLAGKWPAIADAAANHATGSVREVAINIVDTLANFEDFDLQDSSVLTAVTAGLDAAISAGLMEEENKTAILALENNRQSRAQELGFSPVREGEITVARAI